MCNGPQGSCAAVQIETHPRLGHNTPTSIVQPKALGHQRTHNQYSCRNCHSARTQRAPRRKSVDSPKSHPYSQISIPTPLCSHHLVLQRVELHNGRVMAGVQRLQTVELRRGGEARCTTPHGVMCNCDAMPRDCLGPTTTPTLISTNHNQTGSSRTADR